MTMRQPREPAAERRVRCELIAAQARRAGLNADWLKVNRQYDIWRRWSEGRLATGYLMRRTGVRRTRQEGM